MNLWRLPAGVPFADAVASGLLARVSGNPLSLADVQLLLPTRRAARTFAEAFLRQSGGLPLLLPRLTPLGDVDADELALTAGINVPPAVAPRRRQLLLARLIRQHQPTWPVSQSLTLARDLARLMDDMTTEGVDPSRLDDLVATQELATHWQVTLRFLKPVMAAWPAILAEEGGVDAATRRTLLLDAQSAHWEAHPPAVPVIAAGSTGSIPATAALLKTLLRLPQGEVILPALPEAAACAPWWKEIDAPHPLFGLKKLLEDMGTTPEDVKLWGQDTGPAARHHLLHTALLPAEATGLWAGREAHPVLPEDPSLRLVACANEQEEATVIALKLRDALETPGRTALLVTPDRMLARRVAEALRRWHIFIDDSAGLPLARSAPAVFLRALLDYTGGERNPVSFLALMKHPLAAGGVSLGACRRYARLLDQYALRGPRPAPGIEVLTARLLTVAATPSLPEEHRKALTAWLNGLSALLAPLTTLMQAPLVRLADLLETLITTAEALASTPEEAGAERLWRGAAGEALAAWVADVINAAADFPPLPARDAPPALLALLSDGVVRPRQQDHPRLNILGPVEARLQSADVVILGGLNEGTWPAPPAPDPWLSRPMRQALGLRPAEERIGQESHDFYALAAAPDVLLTRSVRQGGTPTVAARWVERLQLVAPWVTSAEATTPSARPWLEWARALDAPVQVEPCPPPRPVPPVALRPRTLSVTDVETLLRDPYAIYARRILKLKALEELEAQPGAAERGSFIHKALYRLLQENPEHPQGLLAADALPTLLRLGDDELEQAGLTPHKPWWWPRFTRLAEWFVATQRQREVLSRPLALEVPGRLALPGDFTLTARADRVDVDAHGNLSVIDYKTGTASSQAARKQGFSAQLPLEAAIARAGGFKGVPAGPVTSLQFWRLTGGAVPGEILDFATDEDPTISATRALEGLGKLLAYYAREDTAYPSQPYGPVRYSDYTHLARVKEWSGSEDTRGEEDA